MELYSPQENNNYLHNLISTYSEKQFIFEIIFFAFHSVNMWIVYHKLVIKKRC